MNKDPEKISIRIGKAFEASAKGRFAIAALVFVALGYPLAKAFGVW